MSTSESIRPAIEQVRKRFDFSLPPDYLRIWESGLLDRKRRRSIRVSRHVWLSPQEIAIIEYWPAWKIKSIIPFAKTPGADHLCWHAPKGGTTYIADCPRDSDFAEGFAQDFEGCLFRSMLDEFSDTWLVEDSLSAAAKKFSSDAKLATSVLRPEWSAILKELAKRPPTINPVSGNPHVTSFDEVTEIVKRELAFPNLGKQFRQHEPSDRTKRVSSPISVPKSVLGKIHDLLARQQQDAFLVLGIYLSRSQVDQIAGLLNMDEPAVGAIGRLHRIPIFLDSESGVADDNDARWMSLHGIKYKYVKMDVVD